METVWKFFGCCFCCPIDWLCDWFIRDWFLLDESCFKLSNSSCRCLICLLNPSSLLWFVDELDRDGGFPLLFLMFSAFSCSIVVLCWVVVDIFVLLDFLSISVLLRLRFNMSEYKVFSFLSFGKSSCSSWTLVWLVLLGLYFKLLYFLNFRCCKTFLVESLFVFISVWMACYWLWLGVFFRELSVFLMSCALFFIVFSQNCTMPFINDSENSLVLNTSYLKIPAHDYQLSVQALLQVL